MLGDLFSDNDDVAGDLSNREQADVRSQLPQTLPKRPPADEDVFKDLSAADRDRVAAAIKERNNPPPQSTSADTGTGWGWLLVLGAGAGGLLLLGRKRR